MLCVSYCVMMSVVLCVCVVFVCLLIVLVWFVGDLLCDVVWRVCVSRLRVFTGLRVVLLNCAVGCDVLWDVAWFVFVVLLLCLCVFCE